MANNKELVGAHLSSLLDTRDPEHWDKLNEFLKNDSSCINEIYRGMTPLIRVLTDDYCTVDFVRLLLSYGADPNLRVRFDEVTPLCYALDSRRDVAIIRLLIENGADVRALNAYGMTSLCYALGNGASMEVLILLLEGGCHPNACLLDGSVLECVAQPTDGGILKEGVLDLMIEAGADVLRDGRYGDSPVCLALQAAAGLDDIRRLLEIGASLDACQRHASPLLCATDFKSAAEFAWREGEVWGMPLKADVVELLLETGAPFDSVNREGYTPLQLAVYCCNYQTRAIKLLLGLPGVDFSVKDEQNGNLLHLAVKNFNCKKSVVKSLIERGVKVDELDALGQTPLRVAVEGCTFGVASLLLKYGSPVNVGDTEGETPLCAAVRCRRGFNIIQLLLFAGARIRPTNDLERHSLLLFAMDHFLTNSCSETLDVLKLLLKYCLLENPDLEIWHLVWRHRIVDNELLKQMTSFANKCANEVQIMKTNNIGINRKLFYFIKRRSFPTQFSAANIPSLSNSEFNRLLSIMFDNELSEYFELISKTIGRSVMKTYLQELQVYATRNMTEKIYLDYDSVCDMSALFSAADLLRLILAYAQENHVYGSGNKRKGKTNSDQLAKKFQRHKNLNE